MSLTSWHFNQQNHVMRYQISLVICLLSLSFRAPAAVVFGTGFNSATGGRMVPSLNLGFGHDSLEALFSSTGVSTKSYYHSAYTLGIYKIWKAGEIAGGGVVTGFGAATLYAVRGFKDSGTDEVSKSDYVLGPGFFGRWHFGGAFFLSVEGLYGLFGPSSNYGDLLVLNARDHVNFVFGIRL